MRRENRPARCRSRRSANVHRQPAPADVVEHHLLGGKPPTGGCGGHTAVGPAHRPQPPRLLGWCRTFIWLSRPTEIWAEVGGEGPGERPRVGHCGAGFVGAGRRGVATVGHHNHPNDGQHGDHTHHGDDARVLPGEFLGRGCPAPWGTRPPRLGSVGGRCRVGTDGDTPLGVARSSGGTGACIVGSGIANGWVKRLCGRLWLIPTSFDNARRGFWPCPWRSPHQRPARPPVA